jgi:cytochrome c oxidase subunit 1
VGAGAPDAALDQPSGSRGLTTRQPTPAGLLGWIATTDHKRIALRMAAVSFAFFLLAGVFALLMRGELAEPGRQIVSGAAYDQLFTMHGSTMVYLVVTPLALAVGLYFVPLQIGAAEVAAPRLTLGGHWLIIAGGLTMYAGFLTERGAGRAGWTGYFPLSGESATPGTGMDLWLLGVILAITGTFIVAGALLATIVRLRAPGMTMLRLPVFTWAMLATSLMTVMALPAVVVAMALVFADRHLGGVLGGSEGPITYQHLFWFYAHPVVYVMFFPFLGIVAEVVATFSARRIFGYRAIVLGLLAFTGLSMSVWAHHMFTTGAVTNEYFSLTSTMLVVPAGTEYFAVIATMIGGSILLRTPMLFALGFLALFLIGGLSGVWVASPPLDYHAQDSYFVVAHFHYTLFAGSLFGLFAGVYYWFPKVTGALLREGLGRIHFALLFVGANLTFFPMFLLGQDGMPRRVSDYLPSDGWEGLNVVATAGSLLIALGVIAFIANLVVSLRDRQPAGDDPWEGQTLEWATTSPPPRFNFTALPPISSYAPLLDRRQEREARQRLGVERATTGDAG